MLIGDSEDRRREDEEQKTVDRLETDELREVVSWKSSENEGFVEKGVVDIQLNSGGKREMKNIKKKVHWRLCVDCKDRQNINI